MEWKKPPPPQKKNITTNLLKKQEEKNKVSVHSTGLKKMLYLHNVVKIFLL